MSKLCNMSDNQYEEALAKILTIGWDRKDRTGTGTRSLFGIDLRYDLSKGFPLITTKKVFTKGIIHELLWMISGDTNIKYLNDNGVHIWDEWADHKGELGPVYGAQWRSHYFFDSDGDARTIDQLGEAIKAIKTNPDSRRILVDSWNVGEVYQMALPPCHLMYQFYVANGRLSCKLTQRSADMFLGVPFNIASYALLTHMVADVTGLEVGDLIWSGGDCHIYHNHMTQVLTQIDREPFEFPQLELTHRANIDDFVYEDVKIVNYQSHPSIKGDVAV